ncbi:MAG: DUF2130 domain-containing protein [Muribaculaceae bacterium]|nr:DUF2130 domain-containing protein [Muribaculaceae bacterium]
MKDIVCPNCHTTFQVDESVYSTILAQVRTKEFNEEVERRVSDIENRYKTREEAIQLKAEKEYETRLSDKNEEINALKNDRIRLQSELEAFNSKKEADITSLEATKDKELSHALAEKDRVISDLNYRITEKEQEIKVKVLETRDACKSDLHARERKILELEAQIESDKLAAKNKETELRNFHTRELMAKQEEIDRLKDFKMRLSTKMLGETLEQHCYIQFNQAKSFGQFPEASLEKDNTVEEGTKGDFIFRDYVDGEECVSIMFEMKNEADTTATKHKNEHFFDKLDKDRHKKRCEYAVLVSMLEQGNELYDAGIVDVGYRYPKMLVIRPQFFLPVLRLISEGARKGHIQNRKLLAELETARNETRDFTRFEEKINNFVHMFGKHVQGAHAKFVSANEGIDKVIKSLENQIEQLRKVKSAFEAADQKLLKADNYVGETLTVRKLTHGAPSVRKMIEDAKDD